MSAINKLAIIGIVVLLICSIYVVNLGGGSAEILIGNNIKHVTQKDTSASQQQYAVSAGHPLAVQAGMDVLRKGGNAVDAAIAISYALSVVQPFASGIGGGGVMLVYPANSEKPVVYDYEATSPKDGSIPERYVGVPGLIKAMEQVNMDYGTMDMAQLIDPAIGYAEKGFKVDDVLHNILVSEKYKLTGNGLSTEFYLGGNPLKAGALLKQPTLAETLRQIQKDGSKAFYEGSIAESIRSKVHGLSKTDLSNYRVLKKEPVAGKYRGYDIFSAPPPFSGITLIQILELAEKMNVDSLYASKQNLSLYSDIVNEAYKKRGETIADPVYMKVDYNKLLEESYITSMLREISSGNFDKSFDDGDEDNGETTHFVVIDNNGMMVSCTNSLSSWFGSGIYTNGFFLNNHLTNLNQYQSSVNHWESDKHPRSFISPTIVAKNGKPVLGIGSPGGRKIPILISQALFKILKDKEKPQTAIDDPRIYLIQNNIYSEGDYLSKDIKNELRAKGYQVINNSSHLAYGALNVLYYDMVSNTISGGADKRRGGSWGLDSAAN